MVLFERVPQESNRAEGLHIFNRDDPEFVAMDEQRLHERLTSHLGELAAMPEREYPDGVAFGVAKDYIRAMALEQMGRGFTPSGLHMETIRQQLGLAYAWWGAQPDDADD